MTTKSRLTSLYDCFLTIIANVSPYVKTFNVVSAKRLARLFVAFSTPSFLLNNETNHGLVFYLLDVFNNIVQYQFDGVCP